MYEIKKGILEDHPATVVTDYLIQDEEKLPCKPEKGDEKCFEILS